MNPHMQLNQFSILHIMLLHEEVNMNLDRTPFFSDAGFYSFETLEAVLHAVKWFI